MPHVLLVATFLLLVSGTFVGGHWYIAQRMVLDPALAEPWRSLGLGVVALGALSMLLQPVGERLLRPPWSRAIAWPASLWMGVAFLLLWLLAASDLALWLVGQPASAAPQGATASTGAAGARALGVAGVAFVAGALGLRQGLGVPSLRRVEIPLERWPRALDGFRIAQISDIHIGPILDARFARAVTERVNALDADLVAVTGDLVDGSVRTLADQVAPFGALRGRHGVFFVTGNHDHYSGASAWASYVAELGMRVLRNERVRIGAGDAAFDLVGVDDHRGGLRVADGREDLPKALAGRDPGIPAVLLAHDPATFRRASQQGVDLQLSGHTHGGQIWPFRYLVRLAVPWVAGLHRVGGSTLYVSRGTGFWGPPMRLRAPAEITELVLRSREPERGAGHDRVE